MTKNKLWDFYCKENPCFVKSQSVNMLATGLKKFFDQTYDMGYKQGVSDTKQSELPKSPSIPDGFEDLFGGFNKK